MIVFWRVLVILILMLNALASFAVQIYAHRGGRALEPENTLIAYRRALSIGVDYVDMDINMTKDGVLVVAHNFALNPLFTANIAGRQLAHHYLIKDLTLHQLETFNVCHVWPNTKYTKLFVHQAHVKICHIPTLQQVIEFVKLHAGKKVGFQIEIKTDPQHKAFTFSPHRLASALDALMNKENIIDRTEVQAFDYRCLQALQKIDPFVKTAYLTEDGSRSMMMSPNKLTASTWTGGPLLKNYHDSIPALEAAMQASLWDPQDITVTQASIQTAHKLGLKVVVWSSPQYARDIFNESLIKKLITWHVDGIITDRPDKLRNLLIKLRMPTPKKIKI